MAQSEQGNWIPVGAVKTPIYDREGEIGKMVRGEAVIGPIYAYVRIEVVTNET